MNLREALIKVRQVYLISTWWNEDTICAFAIVLNAAEKQLQKEEHKFVECEKCQYRSEGEILDGRYWCDLMHTIIPNKDGLCSFAVEKER